MESAARTLAEDPCLELCGLYGNFRHNDGAGLGQGTADVQGSTRINLGIAKSHVARFVQAAHTRWCLRLKALHGAKVLAAAPCTWE